MITKRLEDAYVDLILDDRDDIIKIMNQVEIGSLSGKKVVIGINGQGAKTLARVIVFLMNYGVKVEVK
jgi:hypothetical protein